MIGAQLIVGDLPEPFLEAALRSVSWVDYYVVVTTVPPASDVGYANLQTVKRVVPEDKLRLLSMTDDTPDFAAARNAALGQVADGDYVLIVDADDVHYPEFEGIAHCLIAEGADSITAAFYHLVVYRDAYQDVYPREIVFRKDAATQFVGRVHEQLHTRRQRPVTAEYRYVHYGYVKPQRDVFDRWVRYSELEGEPHHYAGQDPDNIISDRVSVARRFTLAHPPAAAALVEQLPVCPTELVGEPPVGAPKVALILLAKDDAALLPGMFETLDQTWGEFDVATLDIGSTDDTQTLLTRKQAEGDQAGRSYPLIRILPADTSLTVALNTALRFLRDQGYDYIGWIHPDMRFEHADWLAGLLHELQCWPRVGKACAANTRDPLPEHMVDGQEQCYLVRTSVLDEIGLFDEGYVGIGGYEDWDMNRRILNAGYRVVVTPRAQVFHQGMATRERRDTTAEQVANAEYFERKWGSRDCPV